MSASPTAIAYRPALALARDLVALTKPRITGLVIATTGTGLFLAPGLLPLTRQLVTLFGTALVVAAASTLNCYLERDLDGLMERTRNRPLPAGRLDARVALVFGLALAAISVPLLWLAVNALTGLLAAIALVSYVLVYTPLKQLSPKALVVGAVPGAIPPLLGWTAVTGTIDAGGLVLFAILFLWQLPHFLAIALYRKEDYAQAGMAVLPVVRGDAVTHRHILYYCGVLLPVSLLLVPLGVAGRAYLVAALVLGGAFLVSGCLGLRKKAGREWAWGLFLLSLAYLPLLFFVLLMDVRR